MEAEGAIRRGVEAAARRLPRWQRGRDWPAARAQRCPGAPPRRSSPPTSSEAAAAVREPGAARSAGSGRRAEEAVALAGRPPPPLRTAPRHRRAADHGPAQGPPGGLGPQPVARYVPPYTPSPPPASGSPSLTRRGLGYSCQEPVAVRTQGPTSAALGYVGPPGTGCSRATPPSSALEGGARRRPEAGTLVSLGRVEEARVEKRRGLVAPPAPCLPPSAPPSFPRRRGGHSRSWERRGRASWAREGVRARGESIPKSGEPAAAVPGRGGCWGRAGSQEPPRVPRAGTERSLGAVGAQALASRRGPSRRLRRAARQSRAPENIT